MYAYLLKHEVVVVISDTAATLRSCHSHLLLSIIDLEKISDFTLSQNAHDLKSCKDTTIHQDTDNGGTAIGLSSSRCCLLEVRSEAVVAEVSVALPTEGIIIPTAFVGGICRSYL